MSDPKNYTQDEFGGDEELEKICEWEELNRTAEEARRS